MYPLSALFLILSGTAALTYQVSWVRLLGLSMGSTSAAISTVLAAFFLGMALGSYSTERITRNRIHNFTPYIVLELLIAISGLALLPILLNLDSMMSGFGEAGTLLSTKFIISMALLLVPTICMGATFPVMAGILVRQQSQIGVRVSQLYSLNTLGAVFGAVLSGFFFIPRFGLDGAIYIAVSLNLIIVLIAVYINRRVHFPPIEEESSDNDSDSDNSTPLSRTLALATLFATGFISIATEVGWTKYLSIFTGTTIYGFAAILAIFLLGISIGSWWIRHHIQRIRYPAIWLATGLMLLAVSLLATRGGLSLIPSIYEGINHMTITDHNRQLIKYVVILLMLLPSTLILGALFPINLRLYCGGLSGVRSRVGKAYAVNTIASILGSLAAGFWIIPVYGTDALLTAMAFITLFVAASYLIVTSRNGQRVIIAGLAIIVIANHMLWPHIDYREMISSVNYQFDTNASNDEEPEFLFLREGKVSVISLVSYDGKYAKVQANGLNESLIDMEDESNALIIETLLGYMPYFLHPDPKSAFVVGYGGGITTRALSHTNVDSIRVVELEPAVVEAGRTLEKGPAKALNDPRVQLDINDARNTLLVEDKRYDIIAAQASHPWLAGASNVFTREFFEIVKSRLNEDGYFSQWVNLFRMDVTTLRAIFQSFQQVFPHVISFANLDTGDFMLLGSMSDIDFNYDQINQRMQKDIIKRTLAHHGVYRARDLLWYFALSQEEIKNATADATPNLDTNILSEVRLSALSRTLSNEEDPYPFLRQSYTLDFTDYVKDKSQLAEKLYDLGEGFLQWEAPDNTWLISKQLRSLSPAHANALEHQLYHWQHNYSAATALYESGKPFLESQMATQMAIYLETNEHKKARALLNKIKDPTNLALSRAMLAYYGLININKTPDYLSDEEKIWHLATQTKNVSDAYFNDLSVFLEQRVPPLVVMRKMTALLLASNRHEQAARYAQIYNSTVDSLVERYVSLIDYAVKQDDATWTDQLLAAIKHLDPDNEEVAELPTTK